MHRKPVILSPFTGIGISISADVYYTPGDSHEIKIEGNSKDVEDLITRVENGMLKMKYEDWRIKQVQTHHLYHLQRT